METQTELKEQEKNNSTKRNTIVIAVIIVLIIAIIGVVCFMNVPKYDKEYDPQLIELTETNDIEKELIANAKERGEEYKGIIMLAVSNQYAEDTEMIQEVLDGINALDGVATARFVLKETNEKDVQKTKEDIVTTFPYLQNIDKNEYKKVPSYIIVFCENNDAVDNVKEELLESLIWKGVCPSPPTPERCMIAGIGA